MAVLLGVSDGLAGAKLEGRAAMWSALALTEGVVVGSSSLRNSPKALPQEQRTSSAAKVTSMTVAG